MWIDIKDGLPEFGLEVNVFVPISNKVTSLVRCEHKEDGYCWDNDEGCGNLHHKEAVTHWQVLPIKPKNK